MEKAMNRWIICFKALERIVLINMILMLFVLFIKLPLLKENVMPDLQSEEKAEVVQEVKKVEPKFDVYPALRNVSGLGKVLSDIESHMPENHTYSSKDKITWAHETTHGIAGQIRVEHTESGLINGFYCLEDRACVMYVPKTRATKAANLVPMVLRGPSFDLYMNKQVKIWDDNPLYIFDEWVAYTNGSMCAKELKVPGLYLELLQAHNFNVYSICLAMLVKKDCPDYDDKQFKSFLMWNIERTYELLEPKDKSEEILSMLIRDREERIKYIEHWRKYDSSINENPLYYGDDKNPTANALEYAKKLREEPSAESVRVFARDYFGKDWCKRIMGF